jgi:hypothetical protein
MRTVLIVVLLLACAAPAEAKDRSVIDVTPVIAGASEARVRHDLVAVSWIFFYSPEHATVRRLPTRERRYVVSWTSSGRRSGEVRWRLVWRVYRNLYTSPGPVGRPVWLPGVTVGEGALAPRRGLRAIQ